MPRLGLDIVVTPYTNLKFALGFQNMHISRVVKKLLVCLYAMMHATLLMAQFESGTVLGTVRDPSGGTVPDASVTLENVKTDVSFQAKTDANGNYQFVNQRLGTYRVRVGA